MMIILKDVLKKKDDFKMMDNQVICLKQLFMTAHQSKELQSDYGVIKNNNEEY